MGMTILLCFTTDDAATAFSGGAPHQDATTTGTPARPGASCEHPLRKQQSGALLSKWQKADLLETMLRLLLSLFNGRTSLVEDSMKISQHNSIENKIQKIIEF